MEEALLEAAAVEEQPVGSNREMRPPPVAASITKIGPCSSTQVLAGTIQSFTHSPERDRRDCRGIPPIRLDIIPPWKNMVLPR